MGVLYLLVALVKNPMRALPLVAITAICLGGFILQQTGLLARIRASLPATPDVVTYAILGVLSLVMLVVVGMLLIPESEERTSRVQAFAGTLLFVGLCTVFSKNRPGIPWRLVLSGLLLQFFMGFFVLRSKVGMHFFSSMGDAVTDFLSMSDVGAKMEFGQDIFEHFFAFKVLPTTIFFSAFISSMYYLGVMQVTVRVISIVLKKLVGASLVQSVNAAGNLFLGQTEAPLLIKPFLITASPCDIHCVMVGGFASIAGGVLAAYIGMGISASQLIGASVMSVPGTLAISNLMCPPGSMPELEAVKEGEQDTDESDKDDDDHFEFPPASENNVIEAAGNGAHIAIDLVLNIGAMLIAFVSLVAVLDKALGYLGHLIDTELSFELVCGYLFWPVAYFLGTPHGDCMTVGKLVGKKIFVNEFIAYADLGTILKEDGISDRGELAAIYALCGFSNIGSIGVQMGCLSSLCPPRQKAFAQLVVSAMISGNIVCFLTATMAGVLN